MTYESGIQKLIKDAKRLYPHLDSRGTGPHSFPHLRNFELNSVDGRREIGTALAFLEFNKSARACTNALGLRDQTEAWGRENGLPHNVSVGALLVAAVHFKMDVK